MDLQRYPVNFGDMANFYKHQKLTGVNHNQNPNYEFSSALYQVQSTPIQTPKNFVGMKAINPPYPSNNLFKMPKPWIAEEHFHVLRTLPVKRQYNVIC